MCTTKLNRCKEIRNTVNRFNKWFSLNYYTLKEKCVFANIFGEIIYRWHEDIFHNTYLAVLDNLTNEKEQEFETIFVSSFRIYCKRALNARVREIVPEETFWKYQKQIPEETEEETKTKEEKEVFAAQILTTAKLTFSKDEYQIFKLYFQSGFTFEQIGDFFGTTQQAVHYRYNNLCSRLFGMYNSSFNSL